MVWAGKIIGSLCGFLLLGNPAGALIGLLIGNLFDRGFKLNSLLGVEKPRVTPNDQTQAVWLQLTFMVMGHIAKLDGRVTEATIESARAVMRSMHLSEDEMKRAIRDFNQGKQSSFNLYQATRQLKYACRNQRYLLKNFIQQQYQVATGGSGGLLSQKKRDVLASICRQLGFEPLIADTFYQYQQQHQRQHSWNGQQSSYSNQQGEYQRSQQRQKTSGSYKSHSLLSNAFAVLGIAESASDSEIKRAYRKLISKYHPDKMMAKGLPQEMLDFAKEKTQTVRKAYEKIRASRGF
jgi:DnaJ like chaperone protein